MDERIRSHDTLGLGSAGMLSQVTTRIGLDPWHGVVQGLASVGLGMPFLIGSPAAMHLVWVLWDSHFRA